MRNIRKCFIWYVMCSKRLLHKFSFVVLLCLIPVLVPLTNAVLSDDAGILKVVLCCEDDDPASERIINKLVNGDGIIRYSVCDTEEEALRQVSKFKADAAWVFAENLTDAINDYVGKRSKKPVVTTIHREESVTLRISREILYGALYEDMGYAIYSNYAKANIHPKEPLTESQLKEHYAAIQKGGDIIQYEHLNSHIPSMKTNYLTAPLRGILALMVVLCTLAAALYFVKDKQEGKFDWLAPQKRLAPAFASCLAACVFSAIAVFVAFRLTGLNTGFARDLAAMLLYVFATTGFCLVFCVLFRSPGKLGAVIPGIIIIMMVLSPIFFSGSELKAIRLCLPSYYYLYAAYNDSYLLYMLYYCVGVYGVVLALNYVVNRNPKPNKFLI